MPPRCAACYHPDQIEIDRMLLTGTALRKVMEKYGMSITALHRHKKHISQVLVEARSAEVVAKAETLLDQVKNLLSQAERITERAETAGSLDTALRGIAQVRGVLELLGEVSGQLAGKGTTVAIGIGINAASAKDLKTMSNQELQEFLGRHGQPLLEGQSHITQGEIS